MRPDLAWLRGKKGPHARAFAPFEIVERAGEGEATERVIAGIATRRGFMGDGFLLEMTAVERAMGEYMDFGLLQASHDLNVRETVGGVSKWETQEAGIWVRGVISQAESALWTKIQEGFVRAFSIAFAIRDYVYDEVLDIVRVTDVEIPEISVVALPRDRGAGFELARDVRADADALLERLRRDHGEAPAPVVEYGCDPAAVASGARAVVESLLRQSLTASKVQGEMADAALRGSRL